VVRLAWLGLGLPVVQNALGMAVNLSAVLPTPESFVQFFTSPPVLGVHVVNGFLRVALAAFLLILARRLGDHRVLRGSMAGLLFTIVALEVGFAFTQNNGFSVGMDRGFLRAVVSNVAMLYLGSRFRTAGAPDGPSRPTAATAATPR